MELPADAISTIRLTLRPLTLADADEMAIVLGDERMHEFTGGQPAGVDELRRRYAVLERGRSADGSEQWLNWIARLRQGTAVGVLQSTVTDDGRAADVAWEIGVPWQGRGYAGEAAVAVVEWLTAKGVTSVRACVHPEHAASAAVARRAGLQPTDEVADGEVVWRRP